MKYKVLLLTLVLAMAIAVASIFIPAYLIQPFKAQTKEALRIAYFLRTWAPVITLISFAAGLFLTIRHWRSIAPVLKKIPVILFLVIIGAASWLSFQNYYEWMFGPLPDPKYVRAEQADFITGKDMVLTVTHAGEAAGYPVRLLAYHHLVHDRVGGKPIVATY